MFSKNRIFISIATLAVMLAACSLTTPRQATVPPKPPTTAIAPAVMQPTSTPTPTGEEARKTNAASPSPEPEPTEIRPGAQATKQDTCVIVDDLGNRAIVVRTLLASDGGISTLNGISSLVCTFAHPSYQPDTVNWWSLTNLPNDIRQAQLVTPEGEIPALNFCRYSCSVNDDPVWEWTLTSSGDYDLWGFAQDISNMKVYFSSGVHTVDYNYVMP